MHFAKRNRQLFRIYKLGPYLGPYHTAPSPESSELPVAIQLLDVVRGSQLALHKIRKGADPPLGINKIDAIGAHDVVAKQTRVMRAAHRLAGPLLTKVPNEFFRELIMAVSVKLIKEDKRLLPTHLKEIEHKEQRLRSTGQASEKGMLRLKCLKYRLMSSAPTRAMSLFVKEAETLSYSYATIIVCKKLYATRN